MKNVATLLYVHPQNFSFVETVVFSEYFKNAASLYATSTEKSNVT
jgi:hypothetical protein